MRGGRRTQKRKKSSKATIKTHRKRKPRTKDDWQRLFRERFFV